MQTQFLHASDLLKLDATRKSVRNVGVLGWRLCLSVGVLCYFCPTSGFDSFTTRQKHEEGGSRRGEVKFAVGVNLSHIGFDSLQRGKSTRGES